MSAALGWSVAMPVLASAVVSAAMSTKQAAELAASGVRLVVKRILPIAAALCLVLMFAAHWQVDRLAAMTNE